MNSQELLLPVPPLGSKNQLVDMVIHSRESTIHAFNDIHLVLTVRKKGIAINGSYWLKLPTSNKALRGFFYALSTRVAVVINHKIKMAIS